MTQFGVENIVSPASRPEFIMSKNLSQIIDSPIKKTNEKLVFTETPIDNDLMNILEASHASLMSRHELQLTKRRESERPQTKRSKLT